MKIAIIGSRGYPYVYSGYETFVTELVERLIPLGIEVTVYCHKHLFKEHPETVNGVQLEYIRTTKGKTTAQLVHSAQSMWHAVRQDYDVILAVNSANGPFGLISTLFRKKTCINVDGLEWLRPKWKGLGGKYFYLASWIATKLYDVIITDSDEMGKYYIQEFNTPSEVIAYGANLRYSEKPELIEKWNLEKDSYYLIVGRLIPDNNADIIVREFIQSNSTKKLVIVGDVPYADEYALEIKKNQEKDDRVFFTGYVYDQNILAELYHNCFMYFHGHEFGGTNPTLLKALAYGCGIMALDTVFSQEVLLNGKHGIYFTKKVGHLQQKIEDVERNPRQIQHFKDISRDRITTHYTWEKITQQYVDLFNKMVVPEKQIQHKVKANA